MDLRVLFYISDGKKNADMDEWFRLGHSPLALIGLVMSVSHITIYKCHMLVPQSLLLHVSVTFLRAYSILTSPKVMGSPTLIFPAGSQNSPHPPPPSLQVR